jgi:hypothetical protein
MRLAHAFYARRFGCAPPALIDVSGVPEKSRYAAALSAALTEALAARIEQARRNTQLMRDLVQLRALHELTQENFLGLERFIAAGALANRSETRTLSQSSYLAPLLLGDCEEVRQRLPTATSGLSDIALHLTLSPAESAGVLEMRLVGLEADAELARWQIEAKDLAAGWHRFSLPVALDKDALTAELQLRWQGEGSVSCGLALRHPDPRHQVHRNGAAVGSVMAMRLWTYPAGCAAPLPADAHVPTASGDRAAARPWLLRQTIVSPEAFRDAVNLTPSALHFGFRDDLGALQVHPIPGAISCGLLAHAVPAGCRGILVRVRTAHKDSADIEYRIAIAAPATRPATGDPLPAFGPDGASGWTRIQAEESSDLWLPLDQPLDGANDLYLMTRMADGVTNTAAAWAHFERAVVEM